MKRLRISVTAPHAFLIPATDFLPPPSAHKNPLARQLPAHFSAPSASPAPPKIAARPVAKANSAFPPLERPHQSDATPNRRIAAFPVAAPPDLLRLPISVFPNCIFPGPSLLPTSHPTRNRSNP